MKNSNREIDLTTSNYIYRRLRIKETRCGYCGLGQGCNKKRRRKYYYKTEKHQNYPDWKMMSKHRKQYQKPKLIFKETVRPGYKSSTWIEITW